MNKKSSPVSLKTVVGSDTIKAWSADKTHECILDLLRTAKPTGNVLDVAAGPGAMSHALAQLGYEVRACDLHPGKFQIEDIQCDPVDLNQGLSHYETESFDAIICGDVLEHIENQFLLIRDVARILKPEGVVIFSTPNIAHLQARLFFLLTQHFPGFKKGDFVVGYINPVYPVFFPS